MVMLCTVGEATEKVDAFTRGGEGLVSVKCALIVQAETVCCNCTYTLIFILIEAVGGYHETDENKETDGRTLCV